MKSRKQDRGSLQSTIWQVPDALWEQIVPLLVELDPPQRRGRKRIDPRAALEAIIFRLRSGCQWNHLPKKFPDDNSALVRFNAGSGEEY